MSQDDLNKTIHTFTYNGWDYEVDLLRDSCADQSNLWAYDIFDDDGSNVGQVILKTTTPENPDIKLLESECWDEIDRNIGREFES